MTIQVKKVGSNAFGKWCSFNAIVNHQYVISGIASYDEILDLEENATYNDLVLYSKIRNGRTYYRIIKNS